MDLVLCHDGPCGGVFSSHISGLKEKVRKALDLLSSRVGVGLLMASLLQVGDLPDGMPWKLVDFVDIWSRVMAGLQNIFSKSILKLEIQLDIIFWGTSSRPSQPHKPSTQGFTVLANELAANWTAKGGWVRGFHHAVVRYANFQRISCTIGA